MSFKVKNEDIYLRLKGINELFLISFILASVSQVFSNSKPVRTDDQQRPVVLNMPE
jgi:hypothetical protein